MKSVNNSPELFIIAGGNGAGKSTFTDILVPSNTLIINADEVVAKFKKDLTRASLWINHHLNLAKLNKKNISIETNFIYPDEIGKYLEYRESGYKLNLYYLALKDLKESELRVNERASNGGHYIDQYNRELSFNIGKENAIMHSNQFDTVTLISNSLEYNSMLLSAIEQEIIYKDLNAPDWAKSLISDFEIGIKKDRDLDINESIGYTR